MVIALGLFFLLGCNDSPDREAMVSPLIEVAQLDQIDHSKTRIIDFRKPEYYNEGHIPGAQNLWRDAIENPSYSYAGMLASKKHMEKILGGLGITNDHQLILYDDQGLPEAARMWWGLRHYGFSNVKLLNGGIQAWSAAGHSLQTKSENPEPTEFSFSGNSPTGRLINKEELLELISSKEHSYVLVDTRSKDEYMGSKWKDGAAKAGRIPNSIHLDWSEAIHFDGSKKFKSLADLERIFARLGASKEDKIIVYCHSGVRSSHTYFVLTELLGYKNVLNYDGSWTEWSHTDYPYINKLNMLVKN